MNGKYPNAPLCPVCGTRQKPLFTGWFCPLECDRKPPSRVDDEWDTPTQPYAPTNWGARFEWRST